jgi:hypothetical protein
LMMRTFMLTLPAPLVPGAFTMSLHTSEVAALDPGQAHGADRRWPSHGPPR